MIDLGPHQAYILGSYALAFLILGVMVIGSLLQLRAARQRLAALDAQKDASS